MSGVTLPEFRPPEIDWDANAERHVAAETPRLPLERWLGVSDPLAVDDDPAWELERDAA